MLQHRFRQAWRWSLLGSFLIALFWFSYYQFNGVVPLVDTFKLYSWHSFSLPIQLSRWWDILLVPIHVIFLVLIFSLNTDKAFFWAEPLRNNKQGLVQGLTRALVIGLIAGLITTLSWKFNFVYMLSLNLALAIYSIWYHFDMNVYDSRRTAKVLRETFFGFFIFSLVFATGVSLTTSCCRGIVVGMFFGPVFGLTIFWASVLLLVLVAMIISISEINFARKLQTIKYNFWHKVRLGMLHKKPWARFIDWLLDS